MKTYGKSAKGNFQVVDKLPEKHAYCITQHHVAAAQNHGGMLGEAAILESEKKGYFCGVRECDMSFSEHKTGLVVQCLVEPKNDNPAGKECTAYMKKCLENPDYKKNDYVGFVMMSSWEKKD